MAPRRIRRSPRRRRRRRRRRATPSPRRRRFRNPPARRARGSRMRKKGRRGRNSRRASNRRVIARETREVSTAARTLVSSRHSTNRHPRREALVKNGRLHKIFRPSVPTTLPAASVKFSVSVGRERLAVLEGRFSRGARRSDGAALIDHLDLLVYAGRHVGDHRDVVRRVRPRTRGALGAPMSFRHDVPYIDRHRRRRAHDDRTPVALRVRRSRTVSFPVLLTQHHSDEPPSRPPSTQAVRRAGAPPVRDHRERREKNLTSKPPPSFLILVSTLLSSSRVRVRPRLARPSPSSRRRVPRASRGGLPLARFPHLT